MQPWLTPKEDETYYYDTELAEQPISFIESHLTHVDDADRYGEPFLLLDWQKKILRDVEGYRHRITKDRKYKFAFIEGAKGMGKTPFLSAWGLHQFLCDSRAAQYIMSAAVSFSQASLTFDSAKKMIEISKKLSPYVDAGVINLQVQKIIYAAKNSKWIVTSGDSKGKAGPRPNFLIMDELSHWDRKLYKELTVNFFKKRGALALMACNAGWDTSSVCYELHQKAVRILEGKEDDPTFYPVVFAADAKKDDYRSPSSWKKANPSLGHTVPESNIALALKSMQENEFRQLYLTQWTKLSQRWLDMEQWKACIKPIDVDLKTLPLYIGIDCSLSDDITAICFLWVGKDKMYCRIKLYMAAKKAYEYEDKNSIPYTDWATREPKPLITLVDGNIEDDTRRKIAKLIGKYAKKYDVKAVCYDPAYATTLVKMIEHLQLDKYPSGIPCIARRPYQLEMGQGTEELEKRIKEGRIVLPDNDCLTWQAGNAEVKPDKNGFPQIRKENASENNYAGKRSSKIDGIVAIAIAMSQARRHEILELDNQNELSKWDGRIIFA